MKKMILFVMLVSLVFSIVDAQVKIRKVISKAQENDNPYPLVSIRDIQFVPEDLLLEVEKVGANTATNWLKQVSPYTSYLRGRRDTIEIVGQLIVPPKIIAFTGHAGYNFVLRDTSALTADGRWSSIFVRTPSVLDTLALYNAGLLSYEAGDIIRIRGYVDEFPSNNTVSATQFVPIAAAFVPTSTMSQCVEYIDTKPIPPPPTLTAGDFMDGTYGSGRVKFTTGEQWEGCYVQLTNLIVVNHVNITNGTFAMLDENGNEISDMDGSKWFTTRSYKDPASTYTLPIVGQMIDTIRGYIASNSGQEAARGYRIFPVFPNDIVYGKILPILYYHRRLPVAVTERDTPVVSVVSYTMSGDSIASVMLYYRVNQGGWDSLTMVAINDTTYQTSLPYFNTGTFVSYYCTAVDYQGNKRILANAGGGTAPADTAAGFFFYRVSNGTYTIPDVQYTPFKNGASGLVGAVVTVSGVVTADTSSLSVGASGTGPWYIQVGNESWSGLWISGTLDTLYTLRIGDSISVTGTVQEYLQGTSGSVHRVTRLGNVSDVTIHQREKALPPHVLLQTGDFANALTAEPYEGMLVRFTNVTVTNTYPTYADIWEYTIDDGSGPIVVRAADGKNGFSPVAGDTLFGKTTLHVGDRFSFVQGIIYFSFGQYKLVPRTNSDFGDYTPTTSVAQYLSQIPSKYVLSQNYPNPFNPTTNIEFAVPKTGNVTLKIYNILGQEIAKLVDGVYREGTYSVSFDGSKLPSGMYIYRLQTAEGALVKKMVLLK